LRQSGKLSEAVTAAEKMLAIERAVLGDVHSDTAWSLAFLAELHEARQDWIAARKAREEVLAIRTKLLGEKHWQVTDARLNLADVNLLEKLTKEQRQRLDQAASLSNKTVEFYQGGKYQEAEALVQQALEIRKEILGESHRTSITDLNNLALLQLAQGNL